MRRVTLLLLGLCACAPGEALVDPDAGAAPDVAAVDRAAPDVAAVDRAVPDVAAPPDAAPLDASLDASVDVASAPDVAAPDAPRAMDAPPPPDAVTCALPAPAARPPATGPDESAVARAVAGERPDLLAASCVTMGGSHAFLFEVLRRLRARDPRWGLDRSGGSIVGDVVLYFHGDGCPEGRGEVYKFDVIARHCGVPGRDEPPAPAWFDRTSEGGVWTLSGFTPTADAGAPDAPRPVDAAPAPRPLPDESAVVRAVAAERPELLAMSCAQSGGNNEFLFEVVRRLRRRDVRWGLNWKRGVVGDMSQDVVDYYFGPASAPVEGSTDVYILDIIGDHCGAMPRAAWTDVTEATRAGGTIGRWTLANRRDLGP